MTALTVEQYADADRLLAAHDTDPDVASLRAQLAAERERDAVSVRRAFYRAYAASWVARRLRFVADEPHRPKPGGGR